MDPRCSIGGAAVFICRIEEACSTWRWVCEPRREGTREYVAHRGATRRRICDSMASAATCCNVPWRLCGRHAASARLLAGSLCKQFFATTVCKKKLPGRGANCAKHKPAGIRGAGNREQGARFGQGISRRGRRWRCAWRLVFSRGGRSDRVPINGSSPHVGL